MKTLMWSIFFCAVGYWATVGYVLLFPEIR